MGRTRSVRHQIIDWCETNVSQINQIVERLETILACYNEDAPEHTLEVASVLKAGELFRDVLITFNREVKQI